MNAVWRVLLIVYLLTLQVGCAALFRREPAVRPDPERPRDGSTLQRTMNPWILTDLFGDRLIVEIDWVEGLQPNPKALALLKETLLRYSPEGREVEIRLSDRIPRAEWERQQEEDPHLDGLVERYLSEDPHAHDEAVLLYVLYVPHADRRSLFGQQRNWVIERDGVPALMRGAVLFRESIERGGLLWVSGKRIERSTLVHELGHVLGLVSNDEHKMKGNESHCTEVYCVMAVKSMRVGVANFGRLFFTGRFPEQFCKKCQADIHEAQRWWSERAGREPDYLAQLSGAYHRQLATALQSRWLEQPAGPSERRLVAARSRFPTHAAYPLALGQYRARHGEREAAIEELIAAGRVGDSHVRRAAAQTLCGLGSYDNALQLLDWPAPAEMESMFADDRLNQAHLRSWALEGLGRFGEALNELETHDPDRPLARAGLLRRLKAWEQLDELRRESPDELGRKMLLGRTEHRRGRDAAADAAYAQALEIAQTRYESISESKTADSNVPLIVVVISLAEIHAELGHADQAMQALDELDLLMDETNGILKSITRASTVTILGDLDGALRALDGVGVPSGSFSDPCIAFADTALTADAAFQERYPWCSQAASTN